MCVGGLPLDCSATQRPKPPKMAFIFWVDAVFSSTLKKALILHYFFAHLSFYFAKRVRQTPLYGLQIVLISRAAPGGGRF